MSTPIASLTLQKILPCRPAEAFRAWTVPALFQQWFIPASGVRARATMDVKPGGKYQIFFDLPGDKPTVMVNGEFLAIESPKYLEYTWIWAEHANPGAPRHTVVKVSFRDLGEQGTELVLTHEGFTDAEDRDDHNGGWTSILACMATAMAAERKPV